MHCADRRPPRRPAHAAQRGVAIILAMLAVALAAGVAAALLGDFGRSLDSAIGRHDQNQARLLARGAVDWARNVLADDAQRTSTDHFKEPWAVRVPPTPVEEGEVGGSIQDWSGRFNLNNLAPEGKADAAAFAQFVRLLEALGVSPADAAQRAQAVLVTVADATTARDADGGDASATQRATPTGPLLALGELLLLPGFDEALVDRLAPFVAALPSPSTININTAPAEVLYAIVPDLRLPDAQILVAERERAWFKDIADFTARLPSGAQVPSATSLDVKSHHFVVTGHARFGSSVVRMEVLLQREEVWPEILWQRIL